MTVLDELVAGALADAKMRESWLPFTELESLLPATPALDPMPALRAPGISVIAEVKRSSPSKGALAPIEDPAGLAESYETGGASAISVLTEERRFSGGWHHEDSTILAGRRLCAVHLKHGHAGVDLDDVSRLARAMIRTCGWSSAG